MVAVRADGHAAGEHLAQLRPVGMPRAADARRVDEEGRRLPVLAQCRKGECIIADLAVVKGEHDAALRRRLEQIGQGNGAKAFVAQQGKLPTQLLACEPVLVGRLLVAAVDTVIHQHGHAAHRPARFGLGGGYHAFSLRGPRLRTMPTRKARFIATMK